MKADTTEIRAARALEQMADAFNELVVWSRVNVELQKKLLEVVLGKPIKFTVPVKKQKRGRR